MDEEKNIMPEENAATGQEIKKTENFQADKAAENATAEEESSDIEIRTEKVNFSEFRTLLAGYFDGLAKLIRITKSKDEIIAKLTREVQTYREDFLLKLVKPLCVSLISLREDYRKTLREVNDYAKSKEKVIQYSEYILSDVEEVLLNQNVESNGGKFYLGGELLIEKQPVKACFVKPEIPETPEASQEAFEISSRSFEGIVEYIDTRNKGLAAILQNNALTDATLSAYVAGMESIEANYSDAILLPIYRSLAEMYSLLEGQCEEIKKTVTEENKVEKYTSVLQAALDNIDKILISCGVSIRTEISDVFDPIKDKILKVVSCEDEAKDRKIAKRHTDCYLFENKVLYPSKVDVYKFVK